MCNIVSRYLWVFTDLNPNSGLSLEAQGTRSWNPFCEVFEGGAGAGRAFQLKMIHFNYRPGQSDTWAYGP